MALSRTIPVAFEPPCLPDARVWSLRNEGRVVVTRDSAPETAAVDDAFLNAQQCPIRRVFRQFDPFGASLGDRVSLAGEIARYDVASIQCGIAVVLAPRRNITADHDNHLPFKSRSRCNNCERPWRARQSAVNGAA